MSLVSPSAALAIDPLRVVITGAAGALGTAVTDAFVRAGHDVIGIDKYEGGNANPHARWLMAEDLGVAEQARASISTSADLLGGIDVVIHLVGAFAWSPIAASTAALWRDLYAANVETAFNVIHAALPHLRDGSSVLCVGAAAAQPAAAGMAPYAAAKSGVARLVEALSAELRSRSIRVNAILPAIIDTPRNRADMPDADPAQWTSPEAIADVLLFLAGRQSRAISGALIPVSNPG